MRGDIGGGVRDGRGDGGGSPAHVVLDPELDRMLYASMVRGPGEDGDGELSGLAINQNGVWLGGSGGFRSFRTGNAPGYAAAVNPDSQWMMLVRKNWE